MSTLFAKDEELLELMRNPLNIMIAVVHMPDGDPGDEYVFAGRTEEELHAQIARFCRSSDWNGAVD